MTHSGGSTERKVRRALLQTSCASTRAVATRYDKRDLIYKGTIDVASLRIWLCDPATRQRLPATAVEGREELVENRCHLNGLDLESEDPPDVPGMAAQVLLTPELPRELQTIAIAEDEGREVVSYRPPPVEEPKPSAQEDIVLLMCGSCDQAPMSGDRG